MKLLKRVLLAVLLFAGAGHAIAKARAFDVEDRHLSGFNAVNLAGPFDVYITQGNTESVKVEAPADMMSRIMTDVNNGVLKIYTKHDTWNWGNWWGHKKIIIHVTAKILNNIHISGSGDVFFKDGISANALSLSISGSGDITGRLEAKTLECRISGSGDMKLAGRAESNNVSVVGSGDYRAHDLATANTTVRISGSGDAAVNASERLDATVRGSRDVHYTGSPKNVTKSKSGSGEIHGS